MHRKEYIVPASTELLTPTEAAVVAGVSVRDVNRVFDEKILPESFLEAGEGRRVRSDACAYLQFYFHMAGRLTAPARAHVIHELLVLPRHGARRGGWVSDDDVLSVNFDRFLNDTSKRLSELRRARAMVVEDPEILGGTPVVRGTRVPVHDIAASLDAGRTAEEVRAAYPSLTDEAVELAKVYAMANPLRGRPSRRDRPDMRVLDEGRRPRRSRA
jgi:uncharacterized protein (DUF433 family)